MAATWPELASVVAAFHTAEGASRNDDLYRALANQGLGELSERIGHFETTWNNDGATGSPTISTRYVTFPENLVDLDVAHWDDNRMAEVEESELDEYDALWRNADGVPYAFVRTARGMTLNREPSTTSGLLDLYGTESIPIFSTTEGGTNPLTYLPDIHQFLLVDYMVKGLPIDLREKTDAQIAVMQNARQEAAQRWLTGSDVCVSTMMRRKLRPLTGE